jgi:hypothetical protein
LRLQLPEELAPFELKSLNVTVRVSGNLGEMKLGGWKDGQLHLLHAWDTPVGTLRAELTDVASLPVTDEGSVLLFVSAGEPHESGTEAKPNDYWRIESMAVGMRVLTAPATSSP